MTRIKYTYRFIKNTIKSQLLLQAIRQRPKITHVQCGPWQYSGYAIRVTWLTSITKCGGDILDNLWADLPQSGYSSWATHVISSIIFLQFCHSLRGAHFYLSSHLKAALPGCVSTDKNWTNLMATVYHFSICRRAVELCWMREAAIVGGGYPGRSAEGWRGTSFAGSPADLIAHHWWMRLLNISVQTTIKTTAAFLTLIIMAIAARSILKNNRRLHVLENRLSENRVR